MERGAFSCYITIKQQSAEVWLHYKRSAHTLVLHTIDMFDAIQNFFWMWQDALKLM